MLECCTSHYLLFYVVSNHKKQEKTDFLHETIELEVSTYIRSFESVGTICLRAKAMRIYIKMATTLMYSRR